MTARAYAAPPAPTPPARAAERQQRDAELWAVTSYFNPVGWRSRLATYRLFRAHLDVPLLTVEWSPEGRFELGPGDADLLVQVAGGDLMWQKERLLNLGIDRLPASARYVAWVDCDVVFGDPDWASRACEALAHTSALQLFSEIAYLDASQTAALLRCTDAGVDADLQRYRATSPVVASARIAAESGADALVEADIRGHARPPGATFRLPRNPGMAWAARRSQLAASRLFERAIIGSGDSFFLFAALGRAHRWLAEARRFGYGYLAASRYPDWADALHARLGGDVGFLESPALHLYHGELGDRSYKERHGRFNALGIDIERDIVADRGEPLRFARREPAWEDFMRGYFASRREDAGSPVP